MPISTVVKSFRDGTITLKDGTAVTPLDVEVQFETGSFSISGLKKKLNETTTYLDRGELGSVRHTNRTFPSGSFTAHVTELSDATAENLYDIVRRTGAFAAAVSTLGASADVYTLDIVWKIEGTDFGDASDHTLTLEDCECAIDVAEGDPDTFTVNFVCYGTVTAV